MPGRAADPNAFRRERRDDAGFEKISSEPRSEPAPGWPLTAPTIRELELWAEMWAKPQAVLWLTQDFEVALLVRRMAEAEQPGSPVSLGTLVRQQMASLLLTIPAMRSARVMIAEVVPGPVRQLNQEYSRDRRYTDVDGRRLTASQRMKARNAEQQNVLPTLRDRAKLIEIERENQ